MRTLQNYIDIYKSIANERDIRGEAVDLLANMLGNASYLEEIEHVIYMKEASLDKCSLINSKIQHCMDNMYSVFRGSCPRAIIRFKPTSYLRFDPFEKIITSQNFSVYYLGYWGELEDTEKESGVLDTSGSVISSTTTTNNNENNDETETTTEKKYGFIYDSVSFLPPTSSDTDGSQIIIGLLTPAAKDVEFSSNAINNKYYADCWDVDLSDDVGIWVAEDNSKKLIPRTRIFAEHILDPNKIFDLTITDFGSRLYYANYLADKYRIRDRDSNSVANPNTVESFKARYFKFSTLSEYNENELKRLRLSGAMMVNFSEEGQGTIYPIIDNEIATGVSLIDAALRDNITTIHYKANRDRYVNSILRSNSDIGVMLEEKYPNKVKMGGTTYNFITNGSQSKTSIDLYYIPNNDNFLLSNDEIKEYRDNYRAYYAITDEINIIPGSKYTAIFNISIELYDNKDINWDAEIYNNILVSYEDKFGVSFNESTINEIKTLISKITNVKKINTFEISYLDRSNMPVSFNEIEKFSYFKVKFYLSTSVTKTNINL